MPRFMPRACLALVSMFLFASSPLAAGEFTLERDRGGVERGITILYDGQLFAEYLLHHGPQPIVWPIIGPTGAEMTRQYPMKFDLAERRDHPHHRSLWFTHGDVNGIDFWAEDESKGHGRIEHREFVRVEAGKNEVVIVTRNDWISPDGVKQCEDERTLVFHIDGDRRWIDFDVVIHATNGPVTFGDTKEGSFAVRVPTSMDVDSKLGGAIVNSEGQADKDAWGKPAAWVDYHGPVGEETLGVAIMNHPSSFRYPTPWHVRTYGLFAANPFGLHDFNPAGEEGAYTIESGDSIALRYRVLFHTGDEQEGEVAKIYEAYAREDR